MKKGQFSRSVLLKVPCKEVHAGGDFSPARKKDIRVRRTAPDPREVQRFDNFHAKPAVPGEARAKTARLRASPAGACRHCPRVMQGYGLHSYAGVGVQSTVLTARKDAE